MTYTWSTFKISEALAGALVGFQQTETYDLSKTGTIINEGKSGQYKIIIDGITMVVDMTGVVLSTNPVSNYVGMSLKIVKTEMGDNGSVGSSVARTRGSSGEGHNATAVLSTIEPRDHFAMNVLNAMLVHMDKPETKDDATMLMFSRSAYKWAQAMMIAAADSREGQSTTPSTAVDVKSGDLQSNTEKLLYNISKAMENGIVVRAEDTLTVQAEITDMPDITFDGTPSVNVANMNMVRDSFDIPTISGGIDIDVSIFKSKYIRFEADPMVYSDISIYLTLTTDDGNREVGYVMTRGSVVSLMELDENVTSITSINTKTIRGQGGNDPNEYTLV